MGEITKLAVSSGYAPELASLDECLNVDPESACKVYERLMEGLGDRYRDLVYEAWSTPPEDRRRKFSMIAGMLTAPAWPTCATASRITLIIFLCDGPKAAVEFMEDLDRHMR